MRSSHNVIPYPRLDKIILVGLLPDVRYHEGTFEGKSFIDYIEVYQDLRDR